jgi:tRNA nucleotidyltransferase (CCA-adding enzyme)
MEVILTHENADFDALASLLGASKLYRKAIPILPRRPNRNLRHFLTLYGEELPFVKPEELPRKPIERVTLVDTQGMITLRGMGKNTEVRIIDHHPLSRSLEPNMIYSGGETGATTTIFVEEMCEQGLPLSPIEATLLLLGIYEDTGSLSYPTTTPRDVRCAAWLLEQGASLSVANDFLRYPLSEEQRSLYNQLLEKSIVYDFSGQSVVIASASAEGYSEEISVIAQKLRDLFEPSALFILVKLNDRIQMVARSSSDSIDVAMIASEFGGGGHSRAAAAFIKGKSLEEVHRSVVECLKRHIKPMVTVGKIMSRAVRTVSPQTSVADAAEMMRRYGHEGFPVLKEGKVVGVLTRREIDKALHHGLGEAPIALYMHKGEISVSPHDSVEHLQKVMVENDVGQVPVVEDGKVIGIVTRTDLLKLWASPSTRPQAEEVARMIEEALPEGLLELIKEASRMADEMGYYLYVVGGFVRDLLLGTPTLDLDLVVEGNAIALAKRLVRKVGGRVRSHARFGTAKLIFEDEDAFSVPYLDFVTARTEFYEHPTALPKVERSSIKQDLHRRDFTINTLAICLNPDRYGELLDFYGGERDLKRGIIRVLHSLSFVEDPTRMLRAARLEQRLGFKIEERTEELIGNALGLLDRVSGDRIRNELYLVFQEEEPEKVLSRLDDLGVLAQIHPPLKCDDWLAEKFRLLREAHPSLFFQKSLEPRAKLASGGNRPSPLAYLALLAFRLTAEETESLIKRLKLRSGDAKILRDVSKLKTLLPRLEERLPPSAIYHLLERYSPQALSILWVATDSKQAREKIELYYRDLRYIEPEINGEHLKRMGLEPGPIFGEILRALLDARLDGNVSTLEEEEALVKWLIAISK